MTQIKVITAEVDKIEKLVNDWCIAYEGRARVVNRVDVFFHRPHETFNGAKLVGTATITYTN